MSDSPVPADCKPMIVIRSDLSGFVRAGEHLIEFQLSAHGAAGLAVDLMRFLLQRHPHIGWQVAQQLWESAIAQLTDERLAALIERDGASPQSPPTEVPPHVH